MYVEFIEPASIELDDAIEYYNLQSQGLGDKFLDEVLRTIELITHFPEAWTEGTKHTRKAHLGKTNIQYKLPDQQLNRSCIPAH